MAKKAIKVVKTGKPTPKAPAVAKPAAKKPVAKKAAKKGK